MSYKQVMSGNEPIIFTVAFMSPYFVIYIKCPRERVWQLARSQKEPKVETDGLSSIRIHPVLLFNNREAAVNFATTQLGLAEQKAPSWLRRRFSLFRSLEHFENFQFPEEVIEVTATFKVPPVVHESDVTHLEVCRVVAAQKQVATQN